MKTPYMYIVVHIIRESLARHRCPIFLKYWTFDHISRHLSLSSVTWNSLVIVLPGINPRHSLVIFLYRCNEVSNYTLGYWDEGRTNGRRTRWSEIERRRKAIGGRKASDVPRVDYRFCLPGGPSSSIDIRNPAEPAVELMQKSMNQ